jgi:hypothetical protein
MARLVARLSCPAKSMVRKLEHGVKITSLLSAIHNRQLGGASAMPVDLST